MQAVTFNMKTWSAIYVSKSPVRGSVGTSIIPSKILHTNLHYGIISHVYQCGTSVCTHSSYGLKCLMHLEFPCNVFQPFLWMWLNVFYEKYLLGDSSEPWFILVPNIQQPRIMLNFRLPNFHYIWFEHAILIRNTIPNINWVHFIQYLSGHKMFFANMTDQSI